MGTPNGLRDGLTTLLSDAVKADYVYANDGLVHANANDLAAAVAERLSEHFQEVGVVYHGEFPDGSPHQHWTYTNHFYPSDSDARPVFVFSLKKDDE